MQESFRYVWVSPDSVMGLLLRLAPGTASEAFEAALLDAVKRELFSVLDFDASTLRVKAACVDREPVKLRTSHVAWTYRFVPRSQDRVLLMPPRDEALTLKEVHVLTRKQRRGDALHGSC